jgi:hypothetical protein
MCSGEHIVYFTWDTFISDFQVRHEVIRADLISDETLAGYGNLTVGFSRAVGVKLGDDVNVASYVVVT